MNSEERKVAAFRKRLAARQTSWAIDISARQKRVTLELTSEQQELLKRATRQRVPAVTLVFSDAAKPAGDALAILETAMSEAKRPSRTSDRSAER
jgi:hypothetical protein